MGFLYNAYMYRYAVCMCVLVCVHIHRCRCSKRFNKIILMKVLKIHFGLTVTSLTKCLLTQKCSQDNKYVFGRNIWQQETLYCSSLL